MYSVVMAGGSGTRFWPVSRRKRPKQLLSLTGRRSLLQQTVSRMAPLTESSQVLVVTGASHAGPVIAQLPQLAPSQILAEPVGRNTAAAAGLAAAAIAQHDPAGVCLVLPADHLITDEPLFIRTLERAARAAQEEDVLVTLGLTPQYAATGYGYIEVGELLDQEPPAMHRVRAFHEKPDTPTAQDYLAGGRHLWNSGMFAWRAEVLLAEIERHQPELAAGLAELAPHLGTPGQSQALERVYPGLPSISVDHGILEKTDNLRVVRADFGWSDVGSWEAMADLWPADDAGNVCQDGKVISLEATGNVVSAGPRLAALLGVDDLVVVVTDDVVLVLPKDRAQDVRQMIDLLQTGGLGRFL